MSDFVMEVSHSTEIRGPRQRPAFTPAVRVNECKVEKDNAVTIVASACPLKRSHPDPGRRALAVEPPLGALFVLFHTAAPYGWTAGHDEFRKDDASHSLDLKFSDGEFVGHLPFPAPGVVDILLLLKEVDVKRFEKEFSA